MKKGLFALLLPVSLIILSASARFGDVEGKTLAEMLDEARAADASPSDSTEGVQPSTDLRYSNPSSEMKLALTFDDGPDPVRTPEILDFLSKHRIPATFFVVGENAEIYPELIQRELAEGHEVGNHTFTHADLSKLNYRQQCDEVIFAENVLFEQNEHRTSLLRPPGGLYNRNTFRMAQRFDYTLILWSLDTRDWAHTPSDQITEKVLTEVKDGDVILFHDYISGESPTLAALEKVIPELLRRGYEFVTVSELFGLE